MDHNTHIASVLKSFEVSKKGWSYSTGSSEKQGAGPKLEAFSPIDQSLLQTLRFAEAKDLGHYYRLIFQSF